MARLNSCSKCGGQTAWDSYADYLAAQRQFHHRGVNKAVGGSFVLLAAALFAAFAVAVLIGHKDLAKTSDEIGRDAADIGGRFLVSFVIAFVTPVFLATTNLKYAARRRRESGCFFRPLTSPEDFRLFHIPAWKRWQVGRDTAFARRMGWPGESWSFLGIDSATGFW